VDGPTLTALLYTLAVEVERGGLGHA
jgi:hypothetical protein